MRFSNNFVWESKGSVNMRVLEETYDVIVVGAGHAGCEAALACARLGLEKIGRASCRERV